jgi:hypothetical protein
MNNIPLYLNSMLPVFNPVDFEKGICLPCLVNSIRQTTKVLNRLRIGKFLFSIVWIDQVLYYILMDSENPNCFNDEGFYQEFKKEFPFPKFCEHTTWRAIQPTRILFEFGMKIRPNSHALTNKILTSFQEVWEEVCEWLLLERRADLIFEAMKEFQKDVIKGERVPMVLGYSFNKYLNSNLTQLTQNSSSLCLIDNNLN